METVNQDVANAQVTEEPKATEESKTFTQEELDRIIGERLSRESAKYADYEDLKKKAAKFDEIEEASKSELQKATERADALKAELDQMKRAEAVRSIREEVAKEMNVPVNLLTADTKEDCEAQAKAVLSFAKSEGYPEVRDGGEVTKISSGSTREQFADWLSKQ